MSKLLHIRFCLVKVMDRKIAKDWLGIKCPWGEDEMIDLRIFGGSTKGSDLCNL